MYINNTHYTCFEPCTPYHDNHHTHTHTYTPRRHKFPCNQKEIAQNHFLARSIFRISDGTNSDRIFSASAESISPLFS